MQRTLGILLVKRLLLLIPVTILLFSCSKFRKVQKSSDWRLKYESANRYYERGDYYRATLLFEEILTIVRGLPEGEQVQFYYAYAHFHQGMYLLASHYFETFYQTYSRSEFAEEAQFMNAYSLYRDAPIFNLDQSSSEQAIAYMQLFLNKNPNSEYRVEASEIIDRLQVKLERKSYESAKQYHQLRYHKAAIIAFENFRQDFPSSAFNEELSFLKLDSQYKLARQSILSKQEERFKKVVQYYNEFMSKYPNNSYQKEAKEIYNSSESQISKLANNN